MEACGDCKTLKQEFWRAREHYVSLNVQHDQMIRWSASSGPLDKPLGFASLQKLKKGGPTGSSLRTQSAGTLWNPDPHLRERFCIRRYSRGTGDR